VPASEIDVKVFADVPTAALNTVLLLAPLTVMLVGAVMEPMAPVKVTVPEPAVVVIEFAPSTVLPKVTPLLVVLNASAAPNVTGAL
jgi:hypothetical protein